MMLLLLLLPLSYLAARLFVEWLWFAQFSWQNVLLERWILQVVFAGLAAVPVLLVSRLRLRGSPSLKASPPEQSWLRGGVYGLTLLFVLLVLLGSVLSIAAFTHLALANPLALAAWPPQLHGMLSDERPLLVVLAILTLWVAVRRKHLFWITRTASVCLVLISGRSWGIWSLALLIPSSDYRDGLLNSDASFALARFAALRLALGLAVLLLLLQLSAVLWDHLTRGTSLSDWAAPALSVSDRIQLRRGLVALIFSGSGLVWLSRYQLLWTPTGVVAGAGWLQAHLSLPLRSLLCSLLFLLGLVILCAGSDRSRRRLGRWVLAVIGLTLATEILVTPLIGWLWLRPQEITLQTPYIEEAIQSTRKAFQLDGIVKRSNEPTPNLTAADLQLGASTLDNVRLWDTLPLLQTNSQLQELRVYYRFISAAVDRYPLLADKETAQQVLLAARELDSSELPIRSRSWLNRHFVFTHGYGFTLSPVNTFSQDGLPDYFISDLGPETRIEGNKALGIAEEDVRRAVPTDESALYFGSIDSPYAVVPTSVDEFDYPEGDANVYTSYSGDGGVPIGPLLNRLAAAIDLGEPRLLASPAIRPDSRLQMHREVRERVRRIAPFLDLRGEPYLVSVPSIGEVKGYSRKQHQYWIVEGFTGSRFFPYSSTAQTDRGERYLRNSVKAVVDAYNGKVHFYVSEADDPLIQGWMRLFPSLFEPLDQMPQQLRDHIRVPEELFDVQVSQLLRYHVTDPRQFYSGDDVWQVPIETYGSDQIPVKPYHITAQVQDNLSSEFLLLQPLTPLARPNLNAWLAARNDHEHYGELLLIEFPRDSPILGPEQIQALINQEPEISRLFGLWNRGGSEVLQGNLMVLPVGRTLLYVEPVYLRASKGGLPSLARIVVSDGRNITMAESLEAAIHQLQKKNPPVLTPEDEELA